MPNSTYPDDYNEYKTKSNEIIQDNYLYISHMDEKFQYWKIPVYPDTINDTMQSTFTPNTALGRTAPVYTFSNAGPRTVTIELRMHRELMNDININVSNADLGEGEDYMDGFIRALQAIAVPRYNLDNRAIEPPIVGIRLGKELFIKGVVTSGIGLTKGKPILYNDRYADVSVTLSISEIDPYDQASVFANGGFRGQVSTLRTGAYSNLNIKDDN